MFAISYRNVPHPGDVRRACTALDDYLVHGPQQALDIMQEITGTPSVDMITFPWAAR